MDLKDWDEYKKVNAEGKHLKPIHGTRDIILNKKGEEVPFIVTIALIPFAYEDAMVPASFTLSLISPGQRLGLPLYPDADAKLKESSIEMTGVMTFIDYEGYRLVMNREPGKYQRPIAALEAIKLPTKRRAALLFASATIEAPLDSLEFEIRQVLGKNIEKLISKIQPTPWVTAVVMESLEGLECGKDYYSEAAGGGIS